MPPPPPFQYGCRICCLLYRSDWRLTRLSLPYCLLLLSLSSRLLKTNLICFYSPPPSPFFFAPAFIKHRIGPFFCP
ncbi:hypothetical protein SKAU_G00146940 [Synaphobranchus kaupii]|uniref:Uncharacterized protein n=1 Tax=Synaphobranchus kaupii TaxID=118154 RepID=A0A9Q1FTM7_SYNKA|nr:hypothetical protein SKAU_G00146940 [Synaphobranchus kaupii]